MRDDDDDDLMSTAFPVPEDDLDEIFAALTDESVSSGRLDVHDSAEPTKRKGVRMSKTSTRSSRAQSAGAASGQSPYQSIGGAAAYGAPSSSPYQNKGGAAAYGEPNPSPYQNMGDGDARGSRQGQSSYGHMGDGDARGSRQGQSSYGHMGDGDARGSRQGKNPYQQNGTRVQRFSSVPAVPPKPMSSLDDFISPNDDYMPPPPPPDFYDEADNAFPAWAEPHRPSHGQANRQDNRSGSFNHQNMMMDPIQATIQEIQHEERHGKMPQHLSQNGQFSGRESYQRDMHSIPQHVRDASPFEMQTMTPPWEEGRGNDALRQPHHAPVPASEPQWGARGSSQDRNNAYVYAPNALIDDPVESARQFRHKARTQFSPIQPAISTARPDPFAPAMSTERRDGAIAPAMSTERRDGAIAPAMSAERRDGAIAPGMSAERRDRDIAPAMSAERRDGPFANGMPPVGGVAPYRAAVPQSQGHQDGASVRSTTGSEESSAISAEETMDAQIVRAMAGPNAKALSVSNFVVMTDNYLSNLGEVVVSGELSQINIRNHMYFALKDEESKVDCLMFSSNRRALSFEPKEGQKVFVQGKRSLYKVTGVFKLLVSKMSLAGHGMIMEQLRQLEIKLAKEGVFNRHRQLPPLIQHVAIVTSIDGRVIDDIATNAHRRNPFIDLTFLDTKVQGLDAVPQILRALEYAYVNAQAWQLDAIIIGRGGGSFEDLLCFSDERVVRMVAQSPVPIISAVGHDEDCPLCDQAADIRVSTPTAAAETITPITRAQLLAFLEGQIQRSENGIFRRLDYISDHFDYLFSRLSNAPVSAVLGRRAAQLSELMSRLERYMEQMLNQRQQRLAFSREKLEQVAGVERTHELRLRIEDAIKRLDMEFARRFYAAQDVVDYATNALERNLSLVEHKINDYSYFLDANILPRANKAISDLVESRKESQELYDLMTRLDRAVEHRLNFIAQHIVLYKDRLEQVAGVEQTHELRLRIEDAIKRLDSEVAHRLYAAQGSVDSATNALERSLSKVEYKLNEYAYVLDAKILPRANKVINELVESRKENQLLYELTTRLDRSVAHRLNEGYQRIALLKDKLEHVSALDRTHEIGLRINDAINRLDVVGRRISEAQFSIVNATNALDRHITKIEQRRDEYSYLLDANILPRMDKAISIIVESRKEQLQRADLFLASFYDHEVNVSLSSFNERLLQLITKLKSLDPLYQLNLGLSITTQDGMHSVKGDDLSLGDTIITLMQGYKVTSTVTDIKEHEYQSSNAMLDDSLNSSDA